MRDRKRGKCKETENVMRRGKSTRTEKGMRLRRQAEKSAGTGKGKNKRNLRGESTSTHPHPLLYATYFTLLFANVCRDFTAVNLFSECIIFPGP